MPARKKKTDPEKVTEKDNAKISKLFRHLAHRELDLLEERPVRFSFDNGKPSQVIIVKVLPDHDPTLLELRLLARSKGYKLHLTFPDSVPPANYVENRVTALAEKHSDGKWRISPKFTLG